MAGTRSVCTGPWATEHRNRPKPSITRTKRRKPSHYKDGTKIKPLQHSCASSLGYTSLEEEDSILAGENVNKHRDWRFELLRIIAMFLIVATHFYAADNWSIHTDPNLSRTWASAAHDSQGIKASVSSSIQVRRLGRLTASVLTITDRTRTGIVSPSFTSLLTSFMT